MRWNVAAIIGAIAVLVLMTTTPVSAYDPWLPQNPQIIETWWPDQWWNYDFVSTQEPVEGESEHCDWPVGLIYWHNADCVKVKNLYWRNASLDAVMYDKVNDGSGWEWHPEKGTKGPLWMFPNGYHMRPYGRNCGGNIYQLYDPGSLLEYVIGTAHQDIEFNAIHGWSEETEHYLASILEGRGYAVEWDYYNLDNYEEYRQVGPHVWENDGWATAIDIV